MAIAKPLHYAQTQYHLALNHQVQRKLISKIIKQTQISEGGKSY